MPLPLLVASLSLLLAAGCGDKDATDTATDGGGADGGGGDGGGGDGGGSVADLDGDGFSVEAGDCDDADPQRFPGAPERCNELDDDCDGTADEGLDLDGDGVRSCDSPADCDDEDPARSPALREVDHDETDNDCDGFIDEGTWRLGDLVITEIMNNPAAVADNLGEWVELYNPGTRTVYLNGLTLRSSGEADHVITSASPLAVEPGQYAVVGVNDSRSSNGGVSLLYTWSGLSLSNESDRFGVLAGGTLLDDVAWDDGLTMPDPSGASMNLDELYLGATLNEVADGWCASYEAWAVGSDLGSPGAENVLCTSTDRDLDGYSIEEGDCDERDPTIHPGATETWYDGVDQDCDGWSDNDADFDGYDDRAHGGTDCDDTRASINPGAAEVCDDADLDEDCDGLSDDADSSVSGRSTLYRDADGDGYGTGSGLLLSCEAPAGYGRIAGDCNDGDATVFPGAVEVWYDGVDQDCAGDDDDDADADGYQARARGGTDCDDARADVNPGRPEVCDDADTDEDCDGLADDADPSVTGATTWYPDADGDGYGGDAAAVVSCERVPGHGASGGDCDDTDARVNPGAVEIWYDGVDGDCDGWNDDDADRDGFNSDLVGGDDCDDEDPAIFPYAYESTTDGVDNDCDGDADAADPDTSTTLRLGDDEASTVRFSGFTFPFCGSSRSSVSVISNGRLLFGSSSTDYSESAVLFERGGIVGIAGWWDDLNPSAGGSVSWVQHADAVAIHFRGVYEYGTTTPNTFSYILRDDGRIILAYGSMGARDGLAGWTCGTGRAARQVDLSAEWASLPAGSLGIGKGTEDAVYEFFSGTGSAVGDLSDLVLHFCVGSGTDADGDGWTDDCGDPDDGDASVTP